MAGRLLELGLVVIVIGLLPSPGVNGNGRVQVALREVLAVFATLCSGLCQYLHCPTSVRSGEWEAKYRMLPFTVFGVILRVIR